MAPIHIMALAGVAQLALMAPTASQAQSQSASESAATQRPQADVTVTTPEIVVTAARQGAQTLQNVPLAIQAFTGEQLERRQVQETADLIDAIPGASQGEQVGSVIRTFTLRGVGAAGGVGDSPIGYYIDNVPFAIPNFPLAPPVRFIDLDRVEVLRGPQGTLYGQGSAGGTIIFHTRDPDLDDVTLRTDASLAKMEDAGDLNYNVSGAVSVPLVKDSLAIRISGGYDKRAGYVDVYSGLPTGPRVAKDANDIKNSDVRAVILWKPSSDLTVRAQAWHFEPRQDYTQSINSLEPPQLWFTGTTRGYEKGNFDLYSLGAEYYAGFATLTSSTSYLDAEFSYNQGQFLGVLGQGTLFNGYDAYSFAQEVQLRSNGAGPFHWLAGGFYQKARGTFAFDAVTPVLTANGFNRTKTENYSVFGEVSYDLLDGKIVPLVGVRYYHDKRDLLSEQTFAGVSSVDQGSARPEKVTWRANISFHPTDDLTAFATVSTGFRVGITQTALQVFFLDLDNIPASQGLEPDSLTNYEAGVKARLFDRKVQVGLNLYHIDFKDLQFGLTTSGGVAAFANVGKAKTTGVDLELQWVTPIEGLNLSAVANWNDSKFDDIVPGVTAALPSVRNGARLSNTAKYNYRLDADYERPVGNDLRLFLHGSASTVSSRIMPDGYRVGSFSTYDANVGVRGEHWEVSLFGENLSDERGPGFVRNSLLFAGPFPRTIGVRFRTNFD